VLVYRSEIRRVSPRASIAELQLELGRVRALPAGSALHDGTISVLIDAGALEAAVADAMCSDVDRVPSPLAVLHRVTGALARAAWHTWQSSAWGAGPHFDRASAELATLAELAELTDLAELAELALPAVVELSVPEGFAHYGLFPETYFAAAEQFADNRDGPAVCVGLRSIGTTLAACVAAALAERGWEVESCTVRPRGHPFDRQLALDPQLADAFRRRAGWWHLVVDEGPGLSGSSIAGAVESLAALGVPEARIVVFPGWVSDGSGLRSERARQRWPTLSQQATEFEETWAASGRLAESFGGGTLEDLSAGRWRERWLDGRADWPAVQPQHERRKYLLHTGAPEPTLLRFVGLGRWGARRFARAAALADTGFTPAPLALQHGFVARRAVTGTPAKPGAAEPPLLDVIGRYLAHLRSALPTAPGASIRELEEMIVANSAEALGTEWGERAQRVLTHAIWSERACGIDGRMLPHEWIHTAGGWVKVDGLEHGDDHFLPGPQDIAWDVAGAIVEFDLNAATEIELVERYRAHSGDQAIARRLPTYRLAYAALRTGYACLAAETLRGTDDGARFTALAARYSAVLRNQLLAGVRPPLPTPRRTSQVELVIFDADDTLRETTVPGQPCPYRPDEWRLRPGVRRAVRRLVRRRHPAYVGLASNQDRISYGQLPLANARRLLQDLARAVTGRELAEEAIQLCPHTAEAHCNCRKPEAGMLERIMRHYGVGPDRTLFVGDAETDRQAAANAGVGFLSASEFFKQAGRRADTGG
jgi:histidinol-phosphate phosphatase family protein